MIARALGHLLRVGLVAILASSCGARSGLVDPPADVAAAPPAQVRCPPTASGALCAIGESCCPSMTCPSRYACGSHAMCPALDFSRSAPGIACDEAEDCPGLQCCAVPFTNVLVSGTCSAWSAGCRSTCSRGTSATGVPAGRVCRSTAECGDLGLRCCDCGSSGPFVCTTACEAQGCRSAD